MRTNKQWLEWWPKQMQYDIINESIRQDRENVLLELSSRPSEVLSRGFIWDDSYMGDSFYRPIRDKSWDFEHVHRVKFMKLNNDTNGR